MDSDDIGDISSFAIQPHQKGLLTFYEEQWTKFPSKQNLPPKSINKLARAKRKPLQLHDQPPKLSSSFSESPQLPFLFKKQPSKSIKIQQSTTIRSRLFRYSEKLQPSDTQDLNLKSQRKPKENTIQTIQNSIYKKVAKKETAKERTILQSLHIQNYPFQQYEDDDSEATKLKQHISSIRIKKGSPLKYFHRENFSISAMELNKDSSTQNQNQALNIFGKTQNKYGKYSSSKNVSKYLFPVISPRMISLKKDVQDMTQPGSEDNLCEIYRRIVELREQRK